MKLRSLKPHRSPAVDGQGTSWSHGSVLATWTLRGIVIVVVALSAVGGVGFLSGSSSTPAAVPVLDSPGPSTRAEAFAEHAVAQWLVATSATPGEIPQIFSIDPRDLPDTAPKVANITAADSASVEPGVWSVLVAADVTEPTPDDAAEEPDVAEPSPAPTESVPPAIRRYFHIAVAVQESGEVSALMLPSPAPSPQLLEVRRPYRVELRADDPISAAVGEFLSAYLAGTSPVERLVSPGASFRAPEPAPYDAVEVTAVRALSDPDEVEEGQPLRVVAAARAQSASRPYDVEVALTLTVRAGRWEVVAIDPAPAVAFQPSALAPGAASPTPTTQ